MLAGYEEVKRSQGRMDMEDVLLLTAGLLADDERVAAQVRQQYKWFVVDEFQDVSPLQSALLDLWLGGRDEICVVGDPAQTIYSFAGANADYLRDFPSKHPGTTSVELVRNYRSTPEVVAAANTLLAGTSSTSVAAARPAALRHARRLHRPPRRGGRGPLGRGPGERRSTRPGGRWSEMAVLFRINAQSEAYEEALTELGVPYVIRGAARFFDRPEVREAVTRLRGAARSGAQPADGDTWVDLVRDTLAGMGWTPTRPRPAARPATAGSPGRRWSARPRRSPPRPPPHDLGEFVDDLDRRASEQHAPVAEGVTLATFHAAKGLEWDSVFLVGLQDGTLPITYAQTDRAIEEERRLLYVGMTRARVDLALSWAAGPQPRAGGAPQAVALPRPAAARVGAARAEARRLASGARTCVECGKPLASSDKARRRCADCPAPYDEALFERLREWRLERVACRGDRAVHGLQQRHPRGHRRGAAADAAERCWPSAASVPRSSRSYGDDVLEMVG